MSGLATPRSDEKKLDLEYDGGGVFSNTLTSGTDAASDNNNRGEGPLTIENEKETKRIMRKLDLRVLPICSLLYLASFIDRTAIGNAKVAGMDVDLKLTSTQYQLALTLFFVTYGLLEVPSNLMMKKYGAKIWLPIIVFSWGLVMTLAGIVQNAEGLIINRLFLGATEAGLFPGVSLLLSFLYPRTYLQLRLGTFFSAATIAGAFGGLLAFALTNVKAGGLQSWRWLFIIEGMLTVAIAVLAYFTLISKVEDAKYLSTEEKAYIKDRLEYDGTETPMNDEFQWRFVRAGLADWKTWFSLIIYIGILAPLYSIALTLPSILKINLGYNAIQAQYMTVPVYIVAAIFVLIFSFFSDKTKNRTAFLCLGNTIAAIGWIMIFVSKDPHVRYGGCFLGAIGSYAGFPAVVALLSQNVGGKTKRSVTTAVQVGIGGMCGMVSSNIFLPRESPTFGTACKINIAFSVMSLVGALANAGLLALANRRKQAKVDSGEAARLTRQELADLGDQSPYFQYRF